MVRAPPSISRTATQPKYQKARERKEIDERQEEAERTCRIRLWSSVAYLPVSLVVALSLARASSKTFSRSSSRDSRSVRRDLLFWFDTSLWGRARVGVRCAVVTAGTRMRCSCEHQIIVGSSGEAVKGRVSSCTRPVGARRAPRSHGRTSSSQSRAASSCAQSWRRCWCSPA